MIKKVSLIIILVLQILLINAQDKDIQKIEKLYNSGEYEKCIEKSNKISKKQKKNAIPLVYISFSNFHFFENAKELRKNYYIKLTTYNLINAVKIDSAIIYQSKFKETSQIIHDSILNYAQHLWKTDKEKSEYYFESLVRIFNDTTPEYRELFIPKVIKFTQNLAFKEYSGETNQTDMGGNKQGLWVKKYPNGFVKYEIFFKDNHPAGVYRKYYENGQIKAKMYFDETGENASAILHNPDGSKHSMGYYKNKKRDSLWQYFYNDSLVISEVNYKNGIKNGPEYVYSMFSYPNLLQEKYWKNGVQDSTWARYYPNGNPQFITQFKNGKRNGKYIAYNVDKRIIVTGQYKNDKSTGTWKYWNADDNNYLIVEYENGVPKNTSQFSAQQSKIIKDMEDMKGKFQEPDEEIFNNQGGNNY